MGLAMHYETNRYAIDSAALMTAVYDRLDRDVLGSQISEEAKAEMAAAAMQAAEKRAAQHKEALERQRLVEEFRSELRSRGRSALRDATLELDSLTNSLGLFQDCNSPRASDDSSNACAHDPQLKVELVQSQIRASLDRSMQNVRALCDTPSSSPLPACRHALL